MSLDAENLVAFWLTGRATLDKGKVEVSSFGYDDVLSKCRAAYGWITTKALPCPNRSKAYRESLEGTIGRDPALAVG